MGKQTKKAVGIASDSGIVVGGGKGPRGAKLRAAGLVLLVVLVAGGAGVGVRWLQTKSSPKHNNAPAATKLTPAQQAQNTALSGDADKAQQQIADELKKPNLSTEEKYGLYMQQGTNYQNAGNNQAALDSYKKAAAARQTQNVYEALGAVSANLGDKTGAIAYYKKAIQLVSGPVADEDKAADEQIIKDLGGQP